MHCTETAVHIHNIVITATFSTAIIMLYAMSRIVTYFEKVIFYATPESKRNCILGRYAGATAFARLNFPLLATKLSATVRHILSKLSDPQDL